jgi:hypothetical protein
MPLANPPQQLSASRTDKVRLWSSNGRDCSAGVRCHHRGKERRFRASPALYHRPDRYVVPERERKTWPVAQPPAGPQPPKAERKLKPPAVKKATNTNFR